MHYFEENEDYQRGSAAAGIALVLVMFAVTCLAGWAFWQLLVAM